MAKPATKKNETPDLPDALEQERLLSAVRVFALEPRFAGARRAMTALRPDPPQSLLLEGGSQTERAAAALYWAALLNCPSAVPETPAAPFAGSQPDKQLSDNLALKNRHTAPCLVCPVCLRYVSKLHRDLFFFDGSTESIKIDEVREMRAVLGEPPREGRLRLVIFSEGQALGEAAANALLKSLEEPRPGTVFVLTAPQRERLLPTLVSRSWTLTLPRPDRRRAAPASMQTAKTCGETIKALRPVNAAGQGDSPQDLTDKGEDAANPALQEANPQILEWAEALLTFAAGNNRTGAPAGRGWMERTARRGALDAALAMQLVLYCQGCLLEALSGNLSDNNAGLSAALGRLDLSTTFTHHDLSAALGRLAPASLHILGEALAESQESLNYNVNPALVLDWLATRLFFVFAGDAGR